MTDTNANDANAPRRRTPGVRIGLALALALVATLAAAAYSAPHRAMSRLQAAVRSGDAARIGDLVDYPSLRASLERLEQSRVERAAAGDDRAENPFQAFGTAMGVVYARAGADRRVETALSPAGIDALLLGLAPADVSAPLPTRCPVRRERFESPSRFVARFVDAAGDPTPLALVWRRSGTAWRLSEVRLEGC